MTIQPTQVNTDCVIPLAARDPHRTLGIHVETYGTPAAVDLYSQAKIFNELYFDGSLADIIIEIASPASPNSYATHQSMTPEGVACMIRIAPSVVLDGTTFSHDILLHEMIHIWQCEKVWQGNPALYEKGSKGHGPSFAEKCNEIGKALSLPEVAVKGKGKPDCAYWPYNVRPDGYYGEGKKSAKAVIKSKQPKGSKTRRSAQANEISKVEQAIALFASMSPEETRATLDLLGLTTKG